MILRISCAEQLRHEIKTGKTKIRKMEPKPQLKVLRPDLVIKSKTAAVMAKTLRNDRSLSNNSQF